MILLLASCNDHEDNYPDLRAEPGNPMVEVENDGYIVTLKAEPLSEGQTGLWTVLTGHNGVLEDSTSNNSQFSGEPGAVYNLNWQVHNAISVEDANTSVSFKAMDPEMYMVIGDTIDNMYLDLYGSLPRFGATAKWEILLGDEGVIENPNSHEATLWGKPNEKYKVQYSHIYGDAVETETFFVTLGEFHADAGIDKTVVPSTSENPDSKLITLWANLPYGATGEWTIIDGNDGEVILKDDPHSLFRGTPETVYELEWEVNYQGLTSIDTVQFSIMGLWGRYKDAADGTEYKTVVIGDLEWFAENYRYTYTEDGVEIGNWWYGVDAGAFIEDGERVDTEEERLKYGKLYNLEMAKELAPEGWRLPTIEEFDIMLNNFGGAEFAAPKLREGGISGLNMAMSGYYEPADYYIYARFIGQEVTGLFWVDNEIDYDNPYAYHMTLYAPATDDNGVVDPNTNEGVGEGITHMYYGMSIRYVRDHN